MRCAAGADVALTWERVDLDAGTISVWRSAHEGLLEFTETKYIATSW